MKLSFQSRAELSDGAWEQSMAGQLTLNGADIGNVAALINGDLGAGPLDVEISLDHHVGS